MTRPPTSRTPDPATGTAPRRRESGAPAGPPSTDPPGTDPATVASARPDDPGPAPDGPVPHPGRTDGRRRLPGRVVPCWRWALVAALVPPILLLVALALLVPTDPVWLAAVCWILAAALTIGGAVAVALVPPIRHAVFWYSLSDDQLDVAHGLVFRRRTVVPMHRVQSLRTERGPLARWFGLTSVRVRTAGGSVAINGLELAEGDRISDRISRLADVRDDV